jgi:hypothetical protein
MKAARGRSPLFILARNVAGKPCLPGIVPQAMMRKPDAAFAA